MGNQQAGKSNLDSTSFPDPYLQPVQASQDLANHLSQGSDIDSASTAAQMAKDAQVTLRQQHSLQATCVMILHAWRG